MPLFYTSRVRLNLIYLAYRLQLYAKSFSKLESITSELQLQLRDYCAMKNYGISFTKYFQYPLLPQQFRKEHYKHCFFFLAEGHQQSYHSFPKSQHDCIVVSVIRRRYNVPTIVIEKFKIGIVAAGIYQSILLLNAYAES